MSGDPQSRGLKRIGAKIKQSWVKQCGSYDHREAKGPSFVMPSCSEIPIDVKKLATILKKAQL